MHPFVSSSVVAFGIFICLAVIFLFIFTPAESLRMASGIVFIFFLPGLAWSFALTQRSEIDTLERSVLAIGISIGLVTLVVFSLFTFFRIPITPGSIYLETLGIIITGAAASLMHTKWLKKRVQKISQLTNRQHENEDGHT